MYKKILPLFILILFITLCFNSIIIHFFYNVWLFNYPFSPVVLINSSNPVTQRESLEEIPRIYGKINPAGQDMILKNVMEIYKNANDGSVKNSSEKAFLNIADKRILPFILKEIDNDNDEIFIKALSVIGSPEAFDKLSELYNKTIISPSNNNYFEMMERQKLIIQSIRKINDKRVITFLLKSLSDDFPAGEIEDYEILWKSNDRDVKGELLKIFKDIKPESDKFILIAEIISKSLDNKIFYKWIKDKNPIIRYKGALALGLKGEFHFPELFSVCHKRNDIYTSYNRNIIFYKKRSEGIKAMETLLSANCSNDLKEKVLSIMPSETDFIEIYLRALMKDPSEKTKIIIASHIKEIPPEKLETALKANPSFADIYIFLAEFYSAFPQKAITSNRIFAVDCFKKYLSYLPEERKKNYSMETFDKELNSFYSYDGSFKILINPGKIEIFSPDGKKIKEITLKERHFDVMYAKNYIPKLHNMNMEIKGINSEFIFAHDNVDSYSVLYIISLDDGEQWIKYLGNYGMTNYREKIETDPANNKIIISDEGSGSYGTRVIYNITRKGKKLFF